VGSTNETKKFLIVIIRNPLRISKRAHTFVTQGPTNTNYHFTLSNTGFRRVKCIDLEKSSYGP